MFKNTVKASGFTLVELIVVITILAILGTISFLAFQGYAKDARDSVRISDIALIEKSLELHQLQTGELPAPTNGIDVTFSGGQVWNQGTIGGSVVTNLNKLSEKPVDPLTFSEYTYSRLNTKKEFQVAAVLEGSVSQNSVQRTNGETVQRNDSITAQISKNQQLTTKNWLVNQAHAADGTILANAYVRGSYNGVMAKVATGSTTYVLAVPTIISGDMTLTDILQLQQQNKLVYHEAQNLPDSYKDTIYKRDGGGFIYNPTNIVVYTGSTDSLTDTTNQETLLTNLKAVYTGTDPANMDDTIKKIVASDPSSEAGKLLSSTLVNKNINSQAKIFDPFLDHNRWLCINDEYYYNDSLFDFSLWEQAGTLLIEGTTGRDTSIVGSAADEVFVSYDGTYDRMTGAGGKNIFVFADEFTNGVRERDVITDFDSNNDLILFTSNDYDIRNTSNGVYIRHHNDSDTIYVGGVPNTKDNIKIAIGSYTGGIFDVRCE